MIESLAAQSHDLSKTLEVLSEVSHRPFRFFTNKLLDALVHDVLMENAEPVQLTCIT